MKVGTRDSSGHTTTFTVSSSVTIKDNTDRGVPSNVFLLERDNTREFTPITIDGGLNADARIGVKLRPTCLPKEGDPTTFATGTGLTAATAKAFFSDDGTDYMAQLAADGNSIQMAVGHAEHPICGAVCPGHIVDGETVTHKSVAWTPIHNEEELWQAEADGHYYLTADITRRSTWTPADNIGAGPQRPQHHGLQTNDPV